MFLPLPQCPFCDQTNRVGAKFCDACGSPLHLKPCNLCEAVNNQAAQKCHKCGTELPALPTVSEAAPVSPAWDTSAASATLSDIDFERCLIGGTVPSAPPRKPRLHLWNGTTWRGRGNWYDVDAIRVAQTSFGAADFARLRQLTLSDQESRWPPPQPGAVPDHEVGAIPGRLPGSDSP